jgi:hypothetical protein
VLALMQRFNMPMTREKYLDLAFMGEPPDELGPEQEAELPPQFRRGGATPEA